ncbi:GTP cyclohydrolase II RibA [Pseudomonas sp. RIT623]|uniref:GTP cyclohydrolase II RibA n=1 Tax=Pseudomonas sp. RIT623 TaxID=2559075 RepID=UPI00106FC782|nr:GTP cyclohydrolase II RibA [Pseudomonas sp. RIT623]TFF34367.1 GTP cyclohydrolase II RibA [Pseudomonas sp. RIT623]
MNKDVSLHTIVPISILGGDVDAHFYGFHGFERHQEHFAVGIGPGRDEVPLVRVHSECITGDVFGSQRCDCGPQLQEALRTLKEVGGYLIYLRQEGRGIGLYSKFEAYLLQDSGLDTYEANLRLNHLADSRSFDPAVQILRALGVDQCRLLTNNPEKVAQLRAGGIDVIAQVPTGVFLTNHNRNYLQAKAVKSAHSIKL